MTWDDDDFGFDDDLSDEERNEYDRKNKIRRAHPLTKQVTEIVNLAKALDRSMNKGQQMQGDRIKQSAIMMAANLKGALISGSWLTCMQNAALVRCHAQDLLAGLKVLEVFSEIHHDHIRHFRKEMEKFRDLFVAWTKEIHAMDPEEYVDEWGLFLHPRQLL